MRYHTYLIEGDFQSGRANDHSPSSYRGGDGMLFFPLLLDLDGRISAAKLS